MTDFGADRGGSRSDDQSSTALTSQQDASDVGDLRASMTGLSQLATGTLPLEELLTRVAQFAVRAIPGADGAGVTMYDNGQAATVVSSAPFVAQIDEIQYGLGEGPCISAAAERRTVRSGSLSGEPLWPRFGPRIGRLGVHSVLSLPLLLPDQVVGAINVYAHPKDAFAEHAERLGEQFAVPAAVAVHNAQVLTQAQRLATQLQAALTSRAVIDQAIGILLSRSGGTAEEAFGRLREMSQAENTKLAAIAQQIVDEAVRRARARHTTT